jgi:hypothetical protein
MWQLQVGRNPKNEINSSCYFSSNGFHPPNLGEMISLNFSYISMGSNGPLDLGSFSQQFITIQSSKDISQGGFGIFPQEIDPWKMIFLSASL